jgi:hypothetical protein
VLQGLYVKKLGAKETHGLGLYVKKLGAKETHGLGSETVEGTGICEGDERLLSRSSDLSGKAGQYLKPSVFLVRVSLH